MSDFGLMHTSASYKLGDKESLLSALECLSDNDCDFNGENGLEYLKTEVINANGYDTYEDMMEALEPNGDDDWEEPTLKFESNVAYYINKAKENDGDDETVIRDFLSSWLDYDNYYDEWDVQIIEDPDSKIGFISVAMLTYC